MPQTYTPIASQTLTSNQAAVTFSSIPSTYTDLILISNIQQTATNNGTLRINGDTGTNYSWTFLAGNGTSALSTRGSNKTSIQMDNWSGPQPAGSTFQLNYVQIMNYANTVTNKTIMARSGSGGNATEAVVGLWRNTAAITSLSIQIDVSGNVLAGSNFVLYGIKAA